jgi:uncharacterized metal-binding protein
MADKQILCSYCASKPCLMGDLSEAPKFCPTVTRSELIDEAKLKLQDAENRSMAQDVARKWKQLGKLTRIEETVLYAKLRGYQKLVLAFCIGLSDEAQMLTNVLLGLCVGDDTLFIKHSKAPVTVLAVKDRVLAHNPLGVLYTSRNPFSRMDTKRECQA